MEINKNKFRKRRFKMTTIKVCICVCPCKEKKVNKSVFIQQKKKVKKDGELYLKRTLNQLALAIIKSNYFKDLYKLFTHCCVLSCVQSCIKMNCNENILT